MGPRRGIVAFLPLLSLLTAADAADDVGGFPRELRRRRLGGGRREGSGDEEGEAIGSKETAADSFYDLSLMTKDEKLKMIETVHSLARYEDSIDWDAQRENFIRTVRESRSQSRSADASNDAFEGPMDDDDEYGEAMDGDESLEKRSGIRSADGKKENVHDAHEGVAEDASDDDTTRVSQPNLQSSRGLQRNIVDGDVFDGYEYSRGACPNAGSLGVPCAPNNLSGLCNKYNRRRGSFRACLDACAPAFCCIHDAPRDLNIRAPNCNTDENCPQYNYCYIAWWKLHDTVGPALRLRVEQDDEFFDIPAENIEEDVTNDPLYNQVLLHHFDDLNQVVEDGTVQNPDGSATFNADNIFFDEDYWVYPVTDKVVIKDFQ